MISIPSFLLVGDEARESVNGRLRRGRGVVLQGGKQGGEGKPSIVVATTHALTLVLLCCGEPP